MNKIIVVVGILGMFLLGCSAETAPLETAAVEPVVEQVEVEATVEPTAVPATATPEPTPTEAAPAISEEVLAMTQEELDKALLDAARKDKFEMVEELLAAGADVNTQGSMLGFTPIVVATVRGNLEAFMVFYEHGADLSHIDFNDNTLLHHAAYYGETEIAKLVLEANVVDLEARRDQFGFTPLLVAAFEGNTEVMELFLENGSNIEAVDDWGDTAINVAAWNGEKEVIESLIEFGAIVEVENQSGNTGFDHATSRGHEEVATLLAEAGQN